MICIVPLRSKKNNDPEDLRTSWVKERMEKLGVAMKLSEIGGTEDMIDGITEGTIMLEGGYKVLTKDEVRQIVKESM